MMYPKQQQQDFIEAEVKDIDVHNVIKSLEELREAYQVKFNDQCCDEISLYNRYVQDISELFMETIQAFYSNEKKLRRFFKIQMDQKIEKEAISSTCIISKNEKNKTDELIDIENLKKSHTREEKEIQRMNELEGGVDENKNNRQKMSSELFEHQNGEVHSKSMKKKLEVDSSGSSSRSSEVKRTRALKLSRICREHSCSSDTDALIHEIADKHDQISKLRDRLRKYEDEMANLGSKIHFREKIIKELRSRIKKFEHQNNHSSPSMLTPPRTPELKLGNSNDSCSNSDLEMYKSTFLTVPGQQNNHMSASGDSCFSLYELDQESKNSSEVNFTLCFDDANKDEIERLHHMIVEMESENGCNRLLITKLEDELMMSRKNEMRTKHDRDLKADKLKVLRHKIKMTGIKVSEKSSNDDSNAPQLNLNDLASIEDDLKSEYDIMNNLIKSFETMKIHCEAKNVENRELVKTMEKLKVDLSDALEKNQILEREIELSKLTKNCEQVQETIYVNIARNLSHMLGKEIQPESIGELSSSPESGGSSLSQSNSLTEVINDWRRELEEKNCILREKNSIISTLEEQLKLRDEEIIDIREQCQSVELDRDKNCQMVNQLKSAIQIHNESIQFLKRQNAEIRSELDDTKEKYEKYQDCFNDLKKRNIEIDDENQNLHKTINNLRSTIEELKSNHSIQHSHDIDDLNANINLVNKQLYQENVRKDDQLNLLRDANLQLRSQVFDLNQDINDLLEIIENLKNRRLLEDYKVAQKEQERQIEKEIITKEKDISQLKEFRSRCVEIEAEYLEKMSSQKFKYDTTIKDLESEITTLTEQLIQSHQLNTEHDELMKQTAILQNSMSELENQNDTMRRTIESYQQRFSELQVNIDKSQFENETMTIEMSQIKSDVVDKNRRISELTVEQQKLQTELDMMKKSCKCSPNSSPQRRMTSTVVQMNDLKTKLMNTSLENSKVNEALKRKSSQYEKLQRQSNDEKSRLREECLKSIQLIGELKSKISMLEMKAQEQNDDVIVAKEKVAQSIARMTAIETELSSKNAKLEDLEEREQKWRNQAYEITQEIKSRKDEAFKREEKLIQDLNAKIDAMKDQTRIILQHENSIRYLQSENQTLKNANSSLEQRIQELKHEMDPMRKREKELSELLEKTEEELKSIKAEVSQILNVNQVDGKSGDFDLKSATSAYMNDKGNYEERYQSLLKDFQSLQEEYKTIKELRSDTMGAIELFKRLQTESSEREKVYRHQIAKLQSDKKNLHKDRTHLTKQLLSKHRDMIILNSEIEKFRDYDDYESRSISNSNSIQPFQSVMYPSAIAPLMQTGSAPDLSSDPIALDLKGMTEKLSRTRNFWSHGLKVAATSLIKIPPPESIQQQFQQFQTFPSFQSSQPTSSTSTTGVHEPFILNPNRPTTSQQFHLSPPPTNLFQNFSPPTSTKPSQLLESPSLNDSLDQDSISSETTTTTVIQLSPQQSTTSSTTTTNYIPPEVELRDIRDDSVEEKNSTS